MSEADVVLLCPACKHLFLCNKAMVVSSPAALVLDVCYTFITPPGLVVVVWHLLGPRFPSGEKTQISLLVKWFNVPVIFFHNGLKYIVVLTHSDWVEPSHILWCYHIAQWLWPSWTSLCSTTSETFVWAEQTNGKTEFMNATLIKKRWFNILPAPLILTCRVLSLSGTGCRIGASCSVWQWNKRSLCRSCWLSGLICTRFLWHLSQSCSGVPRKRSQAGRLYVVGTRWAVGPPWTRWSGRRPSEWSGSRHQIQTLSWGRRSCGLRTRCGRSRLPFDYPGHGWSSSPMHSHDSASSYSEKEERTRA